jgi:hypothetical protein
MSTEGIRNGERAASSADRALRRIVAEIANGLRHGYFDFRLTCEVIAHGRRRLVLHAGKSYQFLLAAEECTPSTVTGDPRHADALDAD